MRVLHATIMIAALCALTACAGPSLYHWGRYEDLIYDTYAKPGKEDAGAQAAKLTEDIDKAHAAGKPVPPGVHAHLGFLHYQQGNLAAALQEFQTEKSLFPESATFIDGILNRMSRK